MKTTPRARLQSLQTVHCFPEQIDHLAWQPFVEQQQQDPPEEKKEEVDPNRPESPFKDIDRDLLDDEARGKIEAAEAKFFAAFDKSSEIDKLKADHQKEIDGIRKNSNPTTTATKTDPAPLTMEDEVRAHFKAAGIEDPKVLEANVKLQMGILSKFGDRMGKTLEGVLQPLQKSQNENAATQAFMELRESDENFAIPEVAQAVWDKVQEYIQGGATPTKELIENLGYIHFGKHMKANPDNKVKIQPRQTTPPRTMPNTQTRHTFPGAGHHAIQPNRQSNNGLDPMDSETEAAMLATKQEWVSAGIPVKGMKDQKVIRVTRGN